MTSRHGQVQIRAAVYLQTTVAAIHVIAQMPGISIMVFKIRWLYRQPDRYLTLNDERAIVSHCSEAEKPKSQSFFLVIRNGDPCFILLAS